MLRMPSRLSAGPLIDLLTLSDGLQMPWPTPELRRLAVDLVPLDLRK